ncbi:putative multi antimicrobial extrusion protein [Dioscorea sansibarensis]
MAHVLVGEERTLRKGHIITEVKKQLWLSVPIIVSGVLEKLIQIISLSFVGHLGVLPLSAASMATSISGITGTTVFMGMGNALNTLCGQAYGAKKYHLLGIYLQRAMLVNTVVCIPLAFIWAFAGKILHTIGQNKEILMGAQLYVRCMIPVLFAYGLLQCYYRFLQAQNVAFPTMLTSGFTILVHIFTCWLLITKWKIGYTGAAIANSISYCLSLILIASYVWFIFKIQAHLDWLLKASFA